jgi:Zn-dependent peptidase ImmA (M78 family)
MSTRLTYESEFLKGVNISVVFSEDKKYKELLPLFNKYGYGFMVPNQNLIVINGEILLQNYDPSFLKFIEAHEVAHIILGHNKDRNDDDEIDADLGAYILLRSKGKDDAVELLQKNYEDRHKTKFDEKRVEKLKNYFSR